MRFHANQITLLDSKGRRHIFKLREEEVLAITVRVLSGDEVAEVVYTNKDAEEFDSRNEKRVLSRTEYCYILYEQASACFWEKYLSVTPKAKPRERAVHTKLCIDALKRQDGNNTYFGEDI